MFVSNLENNTINNKKYRKIIYTKPNKFQLVLMAIKPGDGIPPIKSDELFEKHRDVVQFIKIESGSCVVYAGKSKKNISKRILRAGMSVVIPNNYWHRIDNISDQPLKLYTIYTPPEH